MLIPRPPRRPSAAHELTGAAAGGAAAAAPLPSASAGLDAEALRRLRELDPTGANRLVARVFAAFETSVARLMPQLQKAHQTGDEAGVRHVVHTLKSSSGSIGALRLSQLCADVEGVMRRDSREGLAEIIEQMEVETALVIAALKTVPGSQP